MGVIGIRPFEVADQPTPCDISNAWSSRRSGARLITFLQPLVLLLLLALAPSLAAQTTVGAEGGRCYVIIDRSESMGDSPATKPGAKPFKTRFEAALDVARQKGTGAIARGETFFLVTFSDDSRADGRSGAPTYYAACTTEEELSERLQKIERTERTAGRTHLWDVFYEVVSDARRKMGDAGGRLTVSVLTDGDDDGSRRTLEEVQRLVLKLRQETTAYRDLEILGYDGVPSPLNPKIPPPPPPPPPLPPPEPEFGLDRYELSATLFSIPQIDTGAELSFDVMLEGKNLKDPVDVEVAFRSPGDLKLVPATQTFQVRPNGGYVRERRRVVARIERGPACVPGKYQFELGWTGKSGSKTFGKPLAPVKLTVTTGPMLTGIVGPATGSAELSYMAIQRGKDELVEFSIEGNAESAGRRIDVFVAPIRGVKVSCVNTDVWTIPEAGRFVASLPNIEPNGPSGGSPAPKRRLVIKLEPDPTITAEPRTLYVRADIGREPLDRRIELRPELAVNRMVVEAQAGICQVPADEFRPMGARLKLIPDNTGVAHRDQLTVEADGVPNGVQIALRDKDGSLRGLPLQLSGERAEFDVQVKWDSSKIRSDDLAEQSQRMMLRLRPTSPDSALVDSSGARGALPTLAFTPIVRVSLESDWGAEVIREVAEGVPQGLTLIVECNELAMNARPMLHLETSEADEGPNTKPIPVVSSPFEQTIKVRALSPGETRRVGIVASVSFGSGPKKEIANLVRKLSSPKDRIEVGLTAIPGAQAGPGRWTEVGLIKFANNSKTQTTITLAFDEAAGASIRVTDMADAVKDPKSLPIGPGESRYSVSMRIDDLRARRSSADSYRTQLRKAELNEPERCELQDRSTGLLNTPFELKPVQLTFSLYRGIIDEEAPKPWSGDMGVAHKLDEGEAFETAQPDNPNWGLRGRIESGAIGEIKGLEEAAAGYRVRIQPRTLTGGAETNPSVAGYRATWRVSASDTATLAQLKTDAGIKLSSVDGAPIELDSVELAFSSDDPVKLQPTKATLVLTQEPSVSFLLTLIAGAILVSGAYLVLRPKKLNKPRRLIHVGPKMEQTVVREFATAGRWRVLVPTSTMSRDAIRIETVRPWTNLRPVGLRQKKQAEAKELLFELVIRGNESRLTLIDGAGRTSVEILEYRSDRWMKLAPLAPGKTTPTVSSVLALRVESIALLIANSAEPINPIGLFSSRGP